MSVCIWIVQGARYNELRFRCFEADKRDSSPSHVIDAMKLTALGHFLPENRFPIDNYGTSDSDAHKRRIPHIFSNGFIFVSEKSANVLKQFDLGEGALYPARLWHPDKETRIPGDFFYLSHGNKKDAFLPERSPEAYKPYRKQDRWRLPPNPVNDQLVFSHAALQGPDVWWDERVMFCFFTSDRLAQALKAAGVAKDWRLLRCPVADT